MEEKMDLEELKQKYAVSEKVFKEQLDLAIRTTTFGKEPDGDDHKKLYVIGRATRGRKNQIKAKTNHRT